MKGKLLSVGLAVLILWQGAEFFPQRQEMEARKPVTALALDDGTRVTALTGVRATEAEEAEVLTGSGESLSAACADLRSSSARRVYLGQVEQILLGEGQNVTAALEWIGRSRELSLDTLLYIVEGDAGAALTADAARAEEEIGGKDLWGQTVGKVLSRLAEGERVMVPLLTAGEDGVAPAGWAILDENGVVGYQKGLAAEGAELLLGYGVGKIAVLETGSAELVSVKARKKGNTLDCTLTARGTEGDPDGEELVRWGEERLWAAVENGWSEQKIEIIRVTGRLVTGGGKE